MTKLALDDGALLGTFPLADEPKGLAFDGFKMWVAVLGKGLERLALDGGS